MGKKRETIGADYRQLKLKIFLTTAVLFLISLAAIALLYRFIFRGRFANAVVGFLDRFFYHDYETALTVYQQIFRNNMDLLFLAAIVAVFLVALGFYLNNFIKYFNEINRGINALIEDHSGDVVLSPELAATERKINHIKHTLQQREAAVQTAEQRKNDLVMYLAHDIRTPLTSVIGYLNLLDEAPDMPPEQRAKYVHITLEKANRLENLVNEFFEITRYNLQQTKLQRETIDLYYMLVQMKDEFYPILSSKGITAVLRADEDLTVSGDPAKLARVFNNILKNAAAYSDPDSQISISAWEEGGSVTVAIQNHGATIPEDKLNAVFEKFYRMDGARASDTGGAGLGLAIAKEIVTLHGGAISAQSKDGTTIFTVSLPASP